MSRCASRGSSKQYGEWGIALNNFFHKYNAAAARRTLAAVGVVAAAGLIAYLLADRVLYQVPLR